MNKKKRKQEILLKSKKVKTGFKKSKKKMISKSSPKDLIKLDPLQSYLKEISRYSLLTRKEEKELARKVLEHNDTEAAYIMVTSNLRLVVKIALEFQKTWMQNLLDLIQEGNIGLVQAVKKFNPYKNVKFSYYASFWIKAYILKFLMDNWRLVKIGTTQDQRKLFFKLKKEKQELIAKGFNPEPKEQSESAENILAKKEMDILLHDKIVKFRKKLNKRELEIFDQRIFADEPVTLQEIGDRYGISRERVRQIEKNIIDKVKDFFKRAIPDFDAYTNNV